MNLLLVDLDGTVRQPISDSQFINSPHDQQLIPLVKETLDYYYTEGWLIIGITNQKGVQDGYKTIDDCLEEQFQTLRLAPQISKIYFCPDEGDTAISCEFVQDSNLIQSQSLGKVITYNRGYFFDSFRKPGKGMIQLAIENSGEESLFEILMVGDRQEDEGAANSAHIPFMWAKDWLLENSKLGILQ